MDIDPAATLAPYPIDVDVGAHTVTIPALPAAAWLAALIAGSDMAIVPGLVEGDALDDDITDGVIDLEELSSAARAALAAAAGTAWWSAARLVGAATQFGLHAELLLAGLDPAVISLGAYLAAALRVATRNLGADKRAEVHFDLDKPPAGMDPAEWFDEDAAAAGFLSALGAPTYDDEPAEVA